MSESRGHNSRDVLNAEITEVMKEKYALAKGSGFDPKTLRALVSLRKKDRPKAKEERAMLELYAHAVGDMDLVS